MNAKPVGWTPDGVLTGQPGAGESQNLLFQKLIPVWKTENRRKLRPNIDTAIPMCHFARKDARRAQTYIPCGIPERETKA